MSSATITKEDNLEVEDRVKAKRVTKSQKTTPVRFLNTKINQTSFKSEPPNKAKRASKV